jgi:hypothetical protein
MGSAHPGNCPERTTIILPRNAPYTADPRTEWIATRRLVVSKPNRKMQ